MNLHQVRLRRVELLDERIGRCVTTLRELHRNGGVVLGIFEPYDPVEFDEAAECDTRYGGEALRALVSNRSVREQLPELQIPESLDDLEGLRLLPALAIEGFLAHQLLVGGAYDRFEGEIEEARQLGRELVDALVGDRLLQVTCGLTTAPWTPWFQDIAWDLTILIRDIEARRFTILCVTDCD